MTCRCVSSHTAARYCRVICGWGSTASSTHENENPAYNNFAQGVDMPWQTAKPAVSCSPTDEISVKRLPSGWSSARHACLTLVTPTAYRAVLPFSRTAWCNACASGRSQPCYSSQSPFVDRFVGWRPEAGVRCGKATPPHALRHPSRRISLGSRRSSARCARTAPDSPFRVVSACDSLPTN